MPDNTLVVPGAYQVLLYNEWRVREMEGMDRSGASGRRRLLGVQ